MPFGKRKGGRKRLTITEYAQFLAELKKVAEESQPTRLETKLADGRQMDVRSPSFNPYKKGTAQ